MLKRQQLTIALALLALSNYALATGLDLHHHHKKEAEVAVSGPREVAVSGPRDVAVSGARSIVPEHKTKYDAVKQALGLGGSVVAESVPSGCQSAYAIVQDNKDFTFLKNAIKATGLESVLNDPALVATIFAPDDEAFTAALDFLEVTPQELFNDVVTLTLVLKYHVIPGLSLEKSDFMDGQPYDTLLTDKHKNKYPVEFDYEKEIDLKALKEEGGLEGATSKNYYIVPSGGDEAGIVTFDVNAGCPTVIHVIDNVLIPAYKDALLADAVDTTIDILATYDAAGAPRPTLPGLATGPKP